MGSTVKALNAEIILDYPNGPILTTPVLKSGAALPGWGPSQSWDHVEGRRDDKPPLKVEGGGREPRIAGGLEVGKGEETESPPEPPGGDTASRMP